eukprot:gene18114-biopygen5248
MNKLLEGIESYCYESLVYIRFTHPGLQTLTFTPICNSFPRASRIGSGRFGTAIFAGPLSTLSSIARWDGVVYGGVVVVVVNVLEAPCGGILEHTPPPSIKMGGILGLVSRLPVPFNWFGVVIPDGGLGSLCLGTGIISGCVGQTLLRVFGRR